MSGFVDRFSVLFGEDFRILKGKKLIIHNLNAAIVLNINLPKFSEISLTEKYEEFNANFELFKFKIL